MPVAGSKSCKGSYGVVRMSAVGRGRVKTRFRSVLGSTKTPPERKRIEYSAFYEVVFADTSFRSTFSHGLDPKRKFIPAKSCHSITCTCGSSAGDPVPAAVSAFAAVVG